MTQRPDLNRQLDSSTFRSYYYLKEELVDFCREYRLPVSGSKEELTDRIAFYLETGEVKKPCLKSRKTVTAETTYLKSPKAITAEATCAKGSKAETAEAIDLDTAIEDNFVCSQKHRAFFEEHIGSSFSFKVAFQKWLKSNSGKTYREAIQAYYQIMENGKRSKTTIDKQFEYNTYIRDFFENNKGKSLEDAIKCWKYKKSLPGHNRYEKSDLAAL